MIATMFKTVKNRNLNQVLSIFQSYEKQIVGSGFQLMESVCEYNENKKLGLYKATFEVPLLANEYVDLTAPERK